MLPKGLQTFVDLGYEMARDFPEFNPVLPCKRKGGRKLTARQKEFNKNQSRIRIVAHNLHNAGCLQEQAAPLCVSATSYVGQFQDTAEGLFHDLMNLWLNDAFCW